MNLKQTASTLLLASSLYTGCNTTQDSPTLNDPTCSQIRANTFNAIKEVKILASTENNITNISPEMIDDYKKVGISSRYIQYFLEKNISPELILQYQQNSIPLIYVIRLHTANVSPEIAGQLYLQGVDIEGIILIASNPYKAVILIGLGLMAFPLVLKGLQKIN